MLRYVLQRLVMLVPVMLGVSVLVFTMIRLVPGDIVDSMLGTEVTTPEVRAQMRATFGLDRPMYVQYLQWLGSILHGDFGVSLRNGEPITSLILSALPVTVELAVFAVVLSCSVAIPLGVISALTRNSWTDLVVRVVGLVGVSFPSFWLATLFLLIAALAFHWLPDPIFVSPFQNLGGNLSQMLMPTLALAAGLSAVVMRQTRSAVLEVLRRDYVRTAQAKGLRERTVIVAHVLRNSLIPVVTVVGLQVGFLLSGTVIIEQIYSIPGMGWLLLNGIYQRDYPKVQAMTLLLAVFFVLTNLIVDIIYVVVDPRIRYVK
jgi:peptide/nickel transport system permease protein